VLASLGGLVGIALAPRRRSGSQADEGALPVRPGINLLSFAFAARSA